MRSRRLGLRTKVAIGFGSLLAIIVAMGLISCRSTILNQQLADQMRLYSALKDYGREMQAGFLTERIGARDILMGRDNENTHLFERGEADLRAAMQGLEPLLPTEKDKGLFAQVQIAASNYSARNRQDVEMYRSGDAQGAIQFFKAPEG